MFIIIELVIFPLGCGVMLDGCTVWVFPDASLASRVAFFTQAPLTAMFYHWVAGTMFMWVQFSRVPDFISSLLANRYQFAILLAGCRNIMRPGAMWFIKDPQDQNFHPIRDILDRPTLTQFRKLLISAFMYAMVVACGVGSLAVLLFIGNKSIFPIRWKTRFVPARLKTDSIHSTIIYSEPLSEVPIDLLFLQIVLPYTMRYLRPRKIIYRISVRVWKFLTARLRLTSYMFGDRSLKEEYQTRYRTWAAFFRRSAKDVEEVTKTRNGTFRRVPASDNIALPRDMRATAEVLENGAPANDVARELIALQNAEATKAKRDVRVDYIVVYFPPRFRTRIIAFVAAVWTIMAIVAAVCIAIPVQFGRLFFTLFTSSQVHDGYSFLAGFYLLWACYLVLKAAERMDKQRQHRTGDGPRAEFAVFFAKRSLLWLSKIAYMAIFLGFIIPTLLGLVVDLYIVTPVRLTLNPTLVPSIRLVDMWSLGLVYCKVVIRIRRRIQLPPRIYRPLQMVCRRVSLRRLLLTELPATEQWMDRP
jgi:E3 ubiquitin-protein ligase MARCH6